MLKIAVRDVYCEAEKIDKQVDIGSRAGSDAELEKRFIYRLKDTRAHTIIDSARAPTSISGINFG